MPDLNLHLHPLHIDHPGPSPLYLRMNINNWISNLNPNLHQLYVDHHPAPLHPRTIINNHYNICIYYVSGIKITYSKIPKQAYCMLKSREELLRNDGGYIVSLTLYCHISGGVQI